MIANEKRNLIISYFSEKKQVLTVSQMKDKINESSKYKFFRFDSDSDSDCGDTIFLLVKQEDNIIKKIFFSDQSSCLISTSATSMLCSWLEENTIPLATKINTVLSNVEKMINGEAYNLDDCKRMEAFKGINHSSQKSQCLHLVIRSFEHIINN